MERIRLAHPRQPRIYGLQDNLSCSLDDELADRAHVALDPRRLLRSDTFGFAIAAHIRFPNDAAQRDKRLIQAERRRLVAAAGAMDASRVQS
jgi:hypothetical protein